MPVTIQSATFGDEFSTTDVLKTLQDQLASNGKIAVDVDSGLIPILKQAGGADVQLKPDEQAEIKQAAADMCGAADQTCLEIKTQELAQAKLKEKAESNVNAANIIKGRRLTVKYMDGTKPVTAVIPEGQRFEAGDLTDPNAGKPKLDVDSGPSPAAQLFSSVWAIIGTTLLTFLYVSSVVITWMTYAKYGNKIVAAGLTIVALVIPYSGFGLSFFGPFIVEYFRLDKLQRLQAVAPEEMGAITKAAAK